MNDPYDESWKFELLAGRPDMGPPDDDGSSNGDGAVLAALMEQSGGRCWYCGCSMTFGVAGSSITREHLLPRARGGTNRRDNIVGACRACNVSKQAKTVEEYRSALGGIAFYGEREQ